MRLQLLNECRCDGEQVDWRLVQMLDYNVPGGKLNRGMAVLDALRALKGETEANFPPSPPPIPRAPVVQRLSSAEGWGWLGGWQLMPGQCLNLQRFHSSAARFPPHVLSLSIHRRAASTAPGCSAGWDIICLGAGESVRTCPPMLAECSCTQSVWLLSTCARFPPSIIRPARSGRIPGTGWYGMLQDISAADALQANILGWCIEWVRPRAPLPLPPG